MNFKRVYTSTKTYFVLSFMALVLLVFTSTMAYKQIVGMQKSAEMVSHSLHVYNAISLLTAHYTEADSEEFRDALLNTNKKERIYNNYQEEGRVIMDSLANLVRDNPSQTKRLESLQVLLNDLYKQLQDLDKTDLEADNTLLQYREAQKSIISISLYQIRSLKNEMLGEEQRLMELRQKTYESDKSLAPLLLLLLAFLALLVFVLSFLRIYRNKLRIRQSENFLKNVLGTTDNVVNYYEPIFNEENDVVDFTIIFANACNRDYFGLEPDDMIGKTVLEVFPFLKDSGNFNHLVACYRNQDKVKFKSQVLMNDSTMWFESLITPLSEGILITARNITVEEEAKNTQLQFRKRLEKQNLILLDNRALLANIFKSISHIVIHLKSIRNAEGRIHDFEIVFVNDRISPVTGDIPEEIKNKNVSVVFPEVFKTGVFEHLVTTIENNNTIEYTVPYEKENRTHWFSTTAIKLGDGVTVTIRDVTEEKEKSNQLIKLNEQLVIRNSILNDAESIAKIGSFLWYRDSDTSELSDNFYRILGFEPNAFTSSSKKFRDFIHPDDLATYDLKLNESLNGLTSEEFTYRIVTKQGETKFVKTNGQFLEKDGQTVMIGVVQDVTQSIYAAEELRKSNLELQQSNAELESFNRVASHDLQEPLRKIQLFISRIEDIERTNFSEKGTTYFNKVKNAAQRMQNLIKNLLAYSRIDSSKTDLETIDLNDVLSKVQEDLINMIKDTQAEIISDQLPEIQGIFFQMEQLFANLIANALKYRNKTKSPKITIQAVTVGASEVPGNINLISKSYYKITFKDNGIGFDTKYSEKIFEVFQRLHQKTEYTGTGIGLAICKKIVENHYGYIHATAKLGEGAQFIIFLPA
ncbi:PAS domain S-box-containing protein [Bizionia echini]|uniref:histidine kinase n=1 Tax=Bizionia echini TaxID=649333 RepID=A0A1I5BGW5_9FLAO|nr:ATP-binding protein [Bizionia echini]SFN73974.1 PAS domain S-box-containing protein [Bizionia echini]